MHDARSRYVNASSRVFVDRRLGALEALVVYLHEVEGLSFAQIGVMLNRDPRTIWNSYSRAGHKRSHRLQVSGQ